MDVFETTHFTQTYLQNIFDSVGPRLQQLKSTLNLAIEAKQAYAADQSRAREQHMIDLRDDFEDQLRQLKTSVPHLKKCSEAIQKECEQQKNAGAENKSETLKNEFEQKVKYLQTQFRILKEYEQKVKLYEIRFKTLKNDIITLLKDSNATLREQVQKNNQTKALLEKLLEKDKKRDELEQAKKKEEEDEKYAIEDLTSTAATFSQSRKISRSMPLNLTDFTDFDQFFTSLTENIHTFLEEAYEKFFKSYPELTSPFMSLKRVKFGHQAIQMVFNDPICVKILCKLNPGCRTGWSLNNQYFNDLHSNSQETFTKFALPNLLFNNWLYTQGLLMQLMGFEYIPIKAQNLSIKTQNPENTTTTTTNNNNDNDAQTICARCRPRLPSQLVFDKKTGHLQTPLPYHNIPSFNFQCLPILSSIEQIQHADDTVKCILGLIGEKFRFSFVAPFPSMYSYSRTPNLLAPLLSSQLQKMRIQQLLMNLPLRPRFTIDKAFGFSEAYFKLNIQPIEPIKPFERIPLFGPDHQNPADQQYNRLQVYLDRLGDFDKFIKYLYNAHEKIQKELKWAQVGCIHEEPVGPMPFSQKIKSTFPFSFIFGFGANSQPEQSNQGNSGIELPKTADHKNQLDTAALKDLEDKIKDRLNSSAPAPSQDQLWMASQVVLYDAFTFANHYKDLFFPFSPTQQQLEDTGEKYGCKDKNGWTAAVKLMMNENQFRFIVLVCNLLGFSYHNHSSGIQHKFSEAFTLEQALSNLKTATSQINSNKTISLQLTPSDSKSMTINTTKVRTAIQPFVALFSKVIMTESNLKAEQSNCELSSLETALKSIFKDL